MKTSKLIIFLNFFLFHVTTPFYEIFHLKSKMTFVANTQIDFDFETTPKKIKKNKVLS